MRRATSERLRAADLRGDAAVRARRALPVPRHAYACWRAPAAGSEAVWTAERQRTLLGSLLRDAEPRSAGARLLRWARRHVLRHPPAVGSAAEAARRVAAALERPANAAEVVAFAELVERVARGEAWRTDEAAQQPDDDPFDAATCAWLHGVLKAQGGGVTALQWLEMWDAWLPRLDAQCKECLASGMLAALGAYAKAFGGADVEIDGADYRVRRMELAARVLRRADASAAPRLGVALAEAPRRVARAISATARAATLHLARGEVLEAFAAAYDRAIAAETRVWQRAVAAAAAAGGVEAPAFTASAVLASSAVSEALAEVRANGPALFEGAPLATARAAAVLTRLALLADAARIGEGEANVTRLESALGRASQRYGRIVQGRLEELRTRLLPPGDEAALSEAHADGRSFGAIEYMRAVCVVADQACAVGELRPALAELLTRAATQATQAHVAELAVAAERGLSRLRSQQRGGAAAAAAGRAAVPATTAACLHELHAVNDISARLAADVLPVASSCGACWHAVRYDAQRNLDALARACALPWVADALPALQAAVRGQHEKGSNAARRVATAVAARVEGCACASAGVTRRLRSGSWDAAARAAERLLVAEQENLPPGADVGAAVRALTNAAAIERALTTSFCRTPSLERQPPAGVLSLRARVLDFSAAAA